MQEKGPFPPIIALLPPVPSPYPHNLRWRISLREEWRTGLQQPWEHSLLVQESQSPPSLPGIDWLLSEWSCWSPPSSGARPEQHYPPPGPCPSSRSWRALQECWWHSDSPLSGGGSPGEGMRGTIRTTSQRKSVSLDKIPRKQHNFWLCLGGTEKHCKNRRLQAQKHTYSDTSFLSGLRPAYTIQFEWDCRLKKMLFHLEQSVLLSP